jgi:hypothetical protein
LAVSDLAGTFTLLAPLSLNGWQTGEQYNVGINPSTTALALMICPSGVYPPSSGAYCYRDPSAASDYPAMLAVIAASLAGTNSALQTGTPPNWQTFLSGLLSDSGAFSRLQSILAASGFYSAAFSPTAVPSAVATLGVVTGPLAGTDDNGTISSSGDGSSGGSCELHWECNQGQDCLTFFGTDNGNFPEPDGTSCQIFVLEGCSGGSCTCVGC